MFCYTKYKHHFTCFKNTKSLNIEQLIHIWFFIFFFFFFYCYISCSFQLLSLFLSFLILICAHNQYSSIFSPFGDYFHLSNVLILANKLFNLAKLLAPSGAKYPRAPLLVFDLVDYHQIVPNNNYCIFVVVIPVLKNKNKTK